MPPQALELVEMAVAESISRVIHVRICLKMVGYIKSVDLIALSFRVQWIFKPVVSVSSFRGSSWTPDTAVYKNKSPASKIRPWQPTRQPTWRPNAKLEAINMFILWTSFPLLGQEVIIWFVLSGEGYRGMTNKRTIGYFTRKISIFRNSLLNIVWKDWKVTWDCVWGYHTKNTWKSPLL